MKVLAVDFGARRVGLAVSDPSGRLARPLTTLERHNDRSLVRRICEIVAAEGVGKLVLGDPVNLDGKRGPASRGVRAFAEKLERASGLEPIFVNESLTSREAEQRLRESGIDPRKHPDRVDAVAAQIILQEALDNELEP
ncbi:MAG: Holliday junction resolvase RuvX [Acidobacteriota bacterium]|nr:Holliday junction resolvase RuvX [Acidobacteriota bacterium]